jgi:hypothetical protein
MMFIVVLLAPTLARPQPLPLPKVGQCPSGYRQSGGYNCPPTSGRSPLGVPKQGQCPSNWVQSGAYCIDTRLRRR